MAFFTGIQTIDIVFASMPQQVPGACPYLYMSNGSFYCRNIQQEMLTIPTYFQKQGKRIINPLVPHCLWNGSGDCNYKGKIPLSS